jgi:alpha-beta hydrolase superfamily lysophospholipase
VAFNDLHRVVRTARRQGRRVILGGHSAGAVTVPAYATWSLHGHPGYKQLAGMLQIDGAEFGACRTSSPGATLAVAVSPWADTCVV